MNTIENEPVVEQATDDNTSAVSEESTESAEQDERKPFTELDQLRSNCIKSKRQLQAIEDQYTSLKKRKMVARRGRCSRVFYKSMMKTIFDYESESE